VLNPVSNVARLHVAMLATTTRLRRNTSPAYPATGARMARKRIAILFPKASRNVQVKGIPAADFNDRRESFRKTKRGPFTMPT
jgi:hypothetical protein